MFPLTHTARLYPVWLPEWPALWWRWTVIACVLIAVLRRYMRHKKTSWPKTTIPLRDPVQQRCAELLEINTSIRTPAEKAKAILLHLFAYIWQEDASVTSLTLAQIKQLPWTSQLLPVFTELYTIVYTDKKVTHSSINTLVQKLHTTLSVSWT